MPKLWTETIEGHRREVRQAILDTTAALAAEHGPLSVTMSQIAEQTGIGRATLYKYFPDVESILLAWHDHQITSHLQELAKLRHRAGDPMSRLHDVLEAYAIISHHSRDHDQDLGAFLHRGERLTEARQELHRMIAELVGEAAAAGDVRNDVAPAELADFSLHAIAGASSLRSKAAVRRLVNVAIDGLRRR